MYTCLCAYIPLHTFEYMNESDSSESHCHITDTIFFLIFLPFIQSTVLHLQEDLRTMSYHIQ